MAVNLILELGFIVQYYSLILRRNCLENYKCEICENLAIFFFIETKIICLWIYSVANKVRNQKLSYSKFRKIKFIFSRICSKLKFQ